MRVCVRVCVCVKLLLYLFQERAALSHVRVDFPLVSPGDRKQPVGRTIAETIESE